MMGLLDGIAHCADHNCPMLRVGDNYECILERMDAHLGNKQVTDVLPGDQNTPVALVFDDGHTLPLLCPDCGGPIQVHAQDLDVFLESVAGLYLVGLVYHEPPEEALGLGFLESADAPAAVPLRGLPRVAPLRGLPRVAPLRGLPRVAGANWRDQAEWLLVHIESARQLACPSSR